MGAINILDSGLIYRNPVPHLRSVHAYFPSLAAISEKEIVCSMVVGAAFESMDCHLELSRSLDGGATWEHEGPMLAPEQGCPDFESCRITRMSDGQLVAFTVFFDRPGPEDGLSNPKTLGLAHTNLSLFRSNDNGRTWNGPEPLAPPLIGPEFEICCRIIELLNGDWLLPLSTWRAWDGSDPTGMKALAFVSHDKGKTWPEYLTVMDGAAEKIIYWEQKIIQLTDKRLLSMAWVYDEKNDRHLPNAYAISADGKTFSQPRSTGINGQTPAIIELDDGRILSVYRRVDQPGLWAGIVTVENDQWQTHESLRLWGTEPQNKQNSMVEQFHLLRFGAPCMVRLAGGEILLAFWCYEDNVSNIRWFRISVQT